jgi:hypothetical protein
MNGLDSEPEIFFVLNDFFLYCHFFIVSEYYGLAIAHSTMKTEHFKRI